jgi:hydrogenase expression/formation protein HypC
MCLGIPGKVTKIYEQDGTLMASVDFDGVEQAVCIATTPEVALGQYVLVHAGFALNVLSDTEAEETLKILRDLQEFNARLTEEDQTK